MRRVHDDGSQYPAVTVETGFAPGVRVIRMCGELDSAARDEVVPLVLEAVEGAGTGVVLELSAVTFFGSMGISLLLEVNEVARRRGIGFAVAAAHRVVVNPLRVTEVDELLAVLPTLDRAVAAAVLGDRRPDRSSHA